MNLSEKERENIKKVRTFKYKGKRYLVCEILLNIKECYGCYKRIDGIKVCLINGNLSERDKQNTLHSLIAERKLRYI